MLRQFPSPLNHFPAPDVPGLSPLSVARAHRNTCSCAQDFHQIPWNSSGRLQSFLPDSCSRVAALSPTCAFSSSQERAPSPSKFHSFLLPKGVWVSNKAPLTVFPGNDSEEEMIFQPNEILWSCVSDHGQENEQLPWTSQLQWGPVREGGLTVRDRQRDPKVTLFSTVCLFPGLKCLIPFVLAGTGGSCQKWDDL